MSAKQAARWRWIAGGLAVALVIGATYLLPVARWVDAAHGEVERLGALGAVAFAVVYVVATLLFVPGSALTLGAGAIFGVAWGFAIVSLAATTTAAVAFLIARHLARAHVEKLARRQPRFAALDAAIGERGWKAVLLLRLSPLIPFDLSNYLFGLTSVGFAPYLLASWIGMLPGTLLYVYLGHVGAEGLGGAHRSPWEWALLGLGVVASAVLVFWIGRMARSAVAGERAAARHP